jgi:hypothetical protein
MNGRCGDPCPQGETICNGECVDLIRDAQHCGACGQVCENGMRCVAGACQCRDGSVNLQADPNNCGRCSNFCVFPGFDGGEGICVDGECALDCGALAVCDAACADLQTEIEHCGVCDTPCPSDAELPSIQPNVLIRDQGCDVGR